MPAQTWIPDSLSLVQAVIGPVISSASDAFQARKLLLVASSLVSFVGAAIAPGSANVYRVIVAQILIGIGFASVPLAYCVPSEILPRKWRPSKSCRSHVLPHSRSFADADSPVAQAAMNIAAALGAISGPLIIGAFTRTDPVNGWRNFYVSASFDFDPSL